MTPFQKPLLLSLLSITTLGVAVLGVNMMSGNGQQEIMTNDNVSFTTQGDPSPTFIMGTGSFLITTIDPKTCMTTEIPACKKRFWKDFDEKTCKEVTFELDCMYYDEVSTNQQEYSKLLSEYGLVGREETSIACEGLRIENILVNGNACEEKDLGRTISDSNTKGMCQDNSRTCKKITRDGKELLLREKNLATRYDPTGKTEICDGRDNDCNGDIDEGFYHKPYRIDSDGDGRGGISVQLSCKMREGLVLKKGDCNDDNNQIFPGSNEQCDGFDNNCDGKIDENLDLCMFNYFQSCFDNFPNRNDFLLSKKSSDYPIILGDDVGDYCNTEYTTYLIDVLNTSDNTKYIKIINNITTLLNQALNENKQLEYLGFEFNSEESYTDFKDAMRSQLNRYPEGGFQTYLNGEINGIPIIIEPDSLVVVYWEVDIQRKKLRKKTVQFDDKIEFIKLQIMLKDILNKKVEIGSFYYQNYGNYNISETNINKMMSENCLQLNNILKVLTAGEIVPNGSSNYPNKISTEIVKDLNYIISKNRLWGYPSNDKLCLMSCIINKIEKTDLKSKIGDIGGIFIIEEVGKELLGEGFKYIQSFGLRLNEIKTSYGVIEENKISVLDNDVYNTCHIREYSR